jgi:DNA-directed RNA polymerase specialized sigma24 family protein
MNELSLVLSMPNAQPSFDALVHDQFNQVLSYEHRLVGDLSVAHRLTEESFQELARFYRKGKQPAEARALLYLLATGRARDFLRRGEKRGLIERFFARRAAPAVQFSEDHAKALTTDTDQRALSTLDIGDRVVLLLHDYCGLTYAEVARAAGIGRSTVGRDLDRARHAFKQAYDYIKF